MAQNQTVKLIDPKATPETKALYSNFIKISQQSLLFGHQDTDAYGTTWKAEEGRSDVKDVCGSHAAVHGWDIGNENELRNVDSVKFTDIHHYIEEVYKRGGINTISWHMDNPVTGGEAWTKTAVVSDIIPGGKDHQAYVKKLDIAADFLRNCKSGNTSIPIIFRPFHEHNGDWFWWGKGNCSEADYIKLWRFTIDYLKNSKQLHHIIYAFSPDRSRLDLETAKQSYFYGYPGDDYVDILGLDDYVDVGIKWNTKSQVEQQADFIKSLTLITNLAKEKNKVAALTETGLESVTNSSWYTNVILNPIKATPSIHIAYVLVWRNANAKHHYAPYPGHASVPDFITFFQDPATLFETDLYDVYK
jgi:mannan endo-1,4-beta-mannosidase